MTTSLTRNRIETIDLLKGLVMVIMALDHVRDYFHASAYLFDPADPSQTTLSIFFTRWITHFCAPAFSFLAGMSAFMVGRKKSPAELSGFLWKRGLWLIFIELTLSGFAWFFDIHFRTFGLLVLWALGISMIFLAALIHLPRTFILIFSLLLIFGHNLLDGINYPGNLIWAILHKQAFFSFHGQIELLVGYPIIPWIAVMSLGYYFGWYYDRSYPAERRRKLFNLIGSSAIVLFIVLRLTNLYGDPVPFMHFDNISKDLVSFLNPTKYPPSLLYLLMTLGVSFVFLANSEKLKGRIVNFFSIFGRVPFFYYVIHLYLIHILALLFALVTGFGWERMILPSWLAFMSGLKGFGYNLGIVYLVWFSVILILYPLCRKFDKYKSEHKEKWWLSYL